MACWMFGFLVLLFVGLCLVDLAKSKAITAQTVLPRTGKPTVSTVDGLAVTVTWSIPANANATQKYEVRYQADGENAVTHKTVSKNSATLNLGPNRWYNIHVKAFGIGSWSDPLRIRSNESRPGKAPQNVKVTPKLPNLHVAWDTIPSDYHNGILLGYVVLIKIDGATEWKKHHTNRTSLQIKGLDTTKVYTIRVAGHTKKGTGARSVAIHFDSNGPLRKTTPQSLKTSAPSSVASTQGTPGDDVTRSVAPLTDKNTKINVDANTGGTIRKTTSEVRSPVPTSEWIEESTKSTEIREIYKTTQIIEAERIVDYSQAKPKEAAFLRKIIFYGVPALGFVVVLSCFVGCLLWRRKNSRQTQLNGDSIQAEKGPKKKKSVVTRGENTVTYCLPPQYIEKQAPEFKTDSTPHSLEIKPFPSGTHLGDAHDQDKQRIYESMDGLQSVLNGEVDEHRYVEPDQLCVVLPAKHPEPGDVHGHKPETGEPTKEPQYANVGQSCHLYEALDFQDQGPFYANAKAAPNSENPYENHKRE